MSGIAFTVAVVTERDWDRALGGWRCPASRIPGAVVDAVYVDGVKQDESRYFVEADHGIVRWTLKPAPPEASIAVRLGADLSPKAELDDAAARAERWKARAAKWQFLTALCGFVGALVGIVAGRLTVDKPVSPSSPPVAVGTETKGDLGSRGKEKPAAEDPDLLVSDTEVASFFSPFCLLSSSGVFASCGFESEEQCQDSLSGQPGGPFKANHHCVKSPDEAYCFKSRSSGGFRGLVCGTSQIQCDSTRNSYRDQVPGVLAVSVACRGVELVHPQKRTLGSASQSGNVPKAARAGTAKAPQRSGTTHHAERRGTGDISSVGGGPTINNTGQMGNATIDSPPAGR